MHKYRSIPVSISVTNIALIKNNIVSAPVLRW